MALTGVPFVLQMDKNFLAKLAVSKPDEQVHALMAYDWEGISSADNGSPSRRNLVCGKCGKKGHLRRDCRAGQGPDTKAETANKGGGGDGGKGKGKAGDKGAKPGGKGGGGKGKSDHKGKGKN